MKYEKIPLSFLEALVERSHVIARYEQAIKLMREHYPPEADTIAVITDTFYDDQNYHPCVGQISVYANGEEIQRTDLSQKTFDMGDLLRQLSLPPVDETHCIEEPPQSMPDIFIEVPE